MAIVCLFKIDFRFICGGFFGMLQLPVLQLADRKNGKVRFFIRRGLVDGRFYVRTLCTGLTVCMFIRLVSSL